MKALPAPAPKAGTSRRLLVLVGLALLVAAGIALMPDETEPPTVVVASASPVRDRSVARPARTATPLAPRLVHAAAVDLFAEHSWYRPPPPPPAPAVAPPPPAPTAPPFPYSYFGQYERPGDKTVYFLQRGDSIFDVKVGQLIDGVWNVDAVADGQMRLTYVPLKLPQVISLGSSP